MKRPKRTGFVCTCCGARSRRGRGMARTLCAACLADEAAMVARFAPIIRWRCAEAVLLLAPSVPLESQETLQRAATAILRLDFNLPFRDTVRDQRGDGSVGPIRQDDGRRPEPWPIEIGKDQGW